MSLFWGRRVVVFEGAVLAMKVQRCRSGVYVSTIEVKLAAGINVGTVCGFMAGRGRCCTFYPAADRFGLPPSRLGGVGQQLRAKNTSKTLQITLDF